MDYKKKYNEALEKAKDALNDGTISSNAIAYLQDIFPELKENNDERIREALIEHIKANCETSFTLFQKFLPDTILAWLEKQKEFVSADFDDVWETADCDELTAPLEKYSKDAIKEMCHAWYDKGIELERKSWIKKQGGKDKLIQELGEYKVKYIQELLSQHLEKQYTDPYNGICFDCYGHRWGICARDNGIEIAMDGKPVRHFSYKDCEQIFGGKSAVEAAKEEKVDNQNCVNPTDKVEPKFHEGEWIITKANNLYQVTAIIDDKYQLKYEDIYSTQKCADVDKIARLWTIQDAKDGDLIYVSTEEKGIQAIFHEYKNDTIFFHCYLCADFVQGGYMPIGSVELTYPLQKTHYNRFFEKMHEAGYEWDAEKKELKKIEDEIEIPFGAKDSELQEATYYIPKGFHAEIDDDKVVIKKGEKPTEWSEEDEKNLQGIIDEIHANRNAGPDYDINTYDRFLDWLKSLKQRKGG